MLTIAEMNANVDFNFLKLMKKILNVAKKMTLMHGIVKASIHSACKEIMLT